MVVTELATTVTGSEPIRLPCVGLHEIYGVCTQVEHGMEKSPRLNWATQFLTVVYGGVCSSNFFLIRMACISFGALQEKT